MIADSIGTSKHTATRLAMFYAIPLRPAGARSRALLPPEWLYYQYVSLGRTIPQIAAATGMSKSAISRRARKFQIPIRPQGGNYQPAPIAPSSQLIQPAMEEVAGLTRLSRLSAIAEHPTLRATAHHCGVEPTKLAADIARLEQQLQHRLIAHHPKHDTVTLTEHGNAVVAATIDLLHTGFTEVDSANVRPLVANTVDDAHAGDDASSVVFAPHGSGSLVIPDARCSYAAPLDAGGSTRRW